MEGKVSKFRYGESVKVSRKASEPYHLSEIGFICGMIDIDSEEAAIAYNCIGSGWLSTVELLDSNCSQITEKFLKKDPQ